jgi:hypothetical protein
MAPSTRTLLTADLFCRAMETFSPIRHGLKLIARRSAVNFRQIWDQDEAFATADSKPKVFSGGERLFNLASGGTFRPHDSAFTRVRVTFNSGATLPVVALPTE